MSMFALQKEIGILISLKKYCKVRIAPIVLECNYKNEEDFKEILFL